MQISLNKKHFSSELYITDNSANIVVSFEFLDVHPTGYDKCIVLCCNKILEDAFFTSQ